MPPSQRFVVRDVAFSPVFDTVGVVPVYATQTAFPSWVCPGWMSREGQSGRRCQP